jgi:putative addiction module killer protein
LKARPRTLFFYELQDGTSPAREWMDHLEQTRTPAYNKVLTRLLRVENGNLGDVRHVGAGVSELRIDFGPGYRVYFGQDGGDLVIVLIGGSKKTQMEDIKTAKSYWSEYNA